MFFHLFLLLTAVLISWGTEEEKEAQQELRFLAGPGTDMNVPVQNSVCCSVKRDPLSGWRTHDAQEGDISMKLCGRRSRGSPDAQSHHSSHLQGGADDVNHADCDLFPPAQVTSALSVTHRNFILITTQQISIQTCVWLHP